MKELTTLNASLATTNAILADAIQSSSEISAKANAKLEQLSANLAGLQAGIGQARATMGPQLKSTVRTRLGNAQAKLQSHAEALAQNKGQLSQQALNAVQEGVGAVTSKVNSEIQSRTENKASLESQIQDLRADVDRQAAAQDRLGSTARTDQVRAGPAGRPAATADRRTCSSARPETAGPAAAGSPRSAAPALSGSQLLVTDAMAKEIWPAALGSSGPQRSARSRRIASAHERSTVSAALQWLRPSAGT